MNDQQKLFLDYLYEDGLPRNLREKAKEAYIKAGYSADNPSGVYQLLRKVNKDIIERNIEYMVQHSAEHIHALQDVVKTPTTPGADTVVKAVNSLLDRSGFGKKETEVVEIKAEKGIVVLPSKQNNPYSGVRRETTLI